MMRLSLLLLAALMSNAAAAESSPAPNGAVGQQQLKALADDMLAWRTATDTGVRLQRGISITAFDSLSQANAQRLSYEARGLLARLRGIDLKGLSSSDRVFAAAMEHDLVFRSEEAQFQDLEQVATPYRGGDIHQFVMRVLAIHPLATQPDLQNYLGLLRSYADVLDEMRERLERQRRLKILLPKPAIPAAIETLASLRKSVVGLTPPSERLSAIDKQAAARFQADARALVTGQIEPRIARLQKIFDASYITAAPVAVGLAQYPNGHAYYRHLIYGYTGETMDPRAIHELGQQRMAEIEAQLTRLRDQVGFHGTRAEFHRMLRTDPRWIAKDPKEVEARYRQFIQKFEPKLPDYFAVLPKARYDVKRLDPSAEPGMTYGYYQQPTDADPVGYYRYNGSDLANRPLIGAQHLIYHELMPGHHLQLSLEAEAPAVHPLRRFLSSAAYTEGWAEYAARLAEEMGLYEKYDMYGHLMLRSFIVTRLVVDTGLNALGWNLDQARQYMREHSLESDRQIDSELLRYSTDIPAQALGYYLGYEKMTQLRHAAIDALGAKFDIKAFNAALLGTGSVPLNALDQRITDFITESKADPGLAALTNTHFAAINRASIVIDRPPSVVWKALLDRASWMPNFGSKRVLAGAPDQTGEVAIYTSRAQNGKSSERLEEVLAAVPNQLLVMRLAPPSGDPTLTFVEFKLSPHGRQTQVDFNLYWVDEASPGASREEIASTRASYVSQTQRTIEEELQALQRSARQKRK